MHKTNLLDFPVQHLQSGLHKSVCTEYNYNDIIVRDRIPYHTPGKIIKDFYQQKKMFLDVAKQ